MREDSKHKGRVIAPFTYSPYLPGIGGVLYKHHQIMIFQHPEHKDVFPAPPMATLRQTANLRHYLCRSRLYKVNNDRSRSTGWSKVCVLDLVQLEDDLEVILYF